MIANLQNICDSVRYFRAAALAYIRQLYVIEKQAKDYPEEKRYELRQREALPALGHFQQWLQDQRRQVLPKSPMAEAIGYALNPWQALGRYTEKGFFRIDNNLVENEIRPLVLGRKNYLFAGSDKGGETAALLYSAVASAKRNGVNLFVYLEEWISRLSGRGRCSLKDLLPDRWEASLKESEKPQL